MTGSNMSALMNHHPEQSILSLLTFQIFWHIVL